MDERSDARKFLHMARSLVVDRMWAINIPTNPSQFPRIVNSSSEGDEVRIERAVVFGLQGPLGGFPGGRVILGLIFLARRKRSSGGLHEIPVGRTMGVPLCSPCSGAVPM